MLNTLRNRTFRHLFAAQLVALVGTGLTTVALGLLAWQLAGADAGLVLGTALAIKMIAYVTLAPVAAALAERLPRRAFLLALDLIRAGVVLFLPFVTEVWQVYVLIFVLQAASAGFTPAFQATIPDVLPGERDYTNALSLMRLTEDLEQLLSPILAAALLTVVSFPVLFGGTVAGFVLSALLVVTVALPMRAPAEEEQFWASTTKGIRIYLATPRLRGLMVMELAVAAAGTVWSGRIAGGAGLCGLWRGVDVGGSPAAAPAGPSGGPPGDAGWGRADGGRGGDDTADAGAGRPDGLVGGDRFWLFADANPHRAHPEPLCPPRRQTRRLCSTVRAVARLLADHLSVGRLAWVGVRFGAGRTRACGCRHRCHARRFAALARP
jgi:MFS family permease